MESGGRRTEREGIKKTGEEADAGEAYTPA